MERKKIIFVLLAVILTIMNISGCAAILEGDMLSVEEHKTVQHERTTDGHAEAANYNELLDAVTELILQHADSGSVNVYSYDGDITEDVQQVALEIKNDNPLGAYAVSEINATASRIVTYYEVEIEIVYKRTKKQVDSIVNVSTLRYLQSELLSFMSAYLEEAAVQTSIRDITAESITEYVREIYYQNPGRIVMLPGLAAETFPGEDGDKVIELRFGNIEPSGILQVYSDSLAKKVSHIVESVSGDSDAAILLALADRIIGSSVYDEGTASVMSDHGAQNFSATAYGALVKGSAVGEGYAMAFKALCDELRFECRVVLGTHDGMVHAWNIVLLDGDYYHIDVSMAGIKGMEYSFLKSDDTLPEWYSWDKESTVSCAGNLTFEDIQGVE